MNDVKINIRPFILADVPALAENANNINVWNNLQDAFPHPYTEKDAEVFIKMNLKKEKPAANLAITVDNQAIGSIGLSLRTDVERITAEMGYFIGEKFWNKGIATQAIKKFVKYVFINFPEILKIYATPFGFNIASQKALQKAGFSLEAVLKKAAIKNGKFIDYHYYSLIKKNKLKKKEIK